MTRGRRVNSSGERSKRLLLEKALELFSTNGYHATKISDIVKEAELTQPTFYLYFQSKESLYQDLNKEFQQQFFGILDSCLEVTHATVTETIQQAIKEILDYFIENPYLTKIGFFDSEDALTVKEKFAYKLIELFEKQQNKERLHGVDSSIFVNSLIGTIERLTLVSLYTGDYNSEELTSQILGIYFTQERVLV